MAQLIKKNKFTFIGTINESAETGNRKNRAVIKSKSSDWVIPKYSFYITANGSNHSLIIQGGHHEGPNAVCTYTTKDRQKRTIPWTKRLEADLSEIYPSNWYTLNLNPYSERELEALKRNENFRNDENLTFEQVEKLIEEYPAKVRNYLCAEDLADAVERLLKSGKNKGLKFKVEGEVSFYLGKDGKAHQNYIVRTVELVRKQPDQALSTVYFLFDESSMGEVEADGSFMMNGWTASYNSKEKKQDYFQYTFRVMPVVKDNPEDTERATQIRRKRFGIKGDTTKECMIVTEIVNGTPVLEFTENDLSEEEKDAIFLGEVTFEEIVAEYRQNGKAGDKIRENRFVKMGRGYTKGAVETGQTIDEILGFASSDDDDDFDLFGDD